MHAGITAITGLAVKNGLAKSVAFGQRNQNSNRLIIFMTDDRPGQLRSAHCRVENERETIPPREVLGNHR